MNLFVTGGAGYIGSHFCKVAKQAGHTITVFDNLSTGHKKFCKFGDLIAGDLKDIQSLQSALSTKHFDAVVHFAAKSLVGESTKFPEIYYENNVIGTRHLVQVCEENKIAKFIFSSSAATYGDPQIDLISEFTPQKPMNPYGKTKLECEEILLEAKKKSGLKLGVLRYFNVIGCDPARELYEDHTPETHLVPNLIKALQTDTEVSVFGNDYATPDGTCVRDYVDVVDLGKVHLAALDFLNQDSLLISNVGRGFGYSVKEVLAEVSETFKKEIKVKNSPRREGDPGLLVADATFFKKWYKKPLLSLKESLQNL